jgi:hypothetical protein
LRRKEVETYNQIPHNTIVIPKLCHAVRIQCPIRVLMGARDVMLLLRVQVIRGSGTSVEATMRKPHNFDEIA